MKRIILYLIAAVVAMLIPVERTDVGKLLPVEVIYIRKNGEMIQIETDTGNRGEGDTLGEAFREMESRAPGVIFLDTASYLLVGEEAEIYINEMPVYMKPWVRVCLAGGELDLKQARAYLDIHRPSTRLDRMESGEIREELVSEEESLKLVKKTENNT